MQQYKEYLKSAKELVDNVAKLTIRQDGLQQRITAPQILQASSSPLAPRPTVPVEARISRFKQELLSSRINLNELRRLAFQGIPDKDGLRAITWKLLLGYLPPDPSEWDEVLTHKRQQYFLFCEELIIDPKRQAQQQQGSNHLTSNSSSIHHSSSSRAAPAGSSGSSSSNSSSRVDSGALAHDSTSSSSSAPTDPLSAAAVVELKSDVPDDHPLSLQSTSRWHTYFKDNEVMEQIDRDVMRTHPDMHFFSGDSAEAEQHRKELKRCLFMFAKLNPGLRYIQGMNELLAPLYYHFKTDPDRASAQYAEADAFYCFVDLISEFRDHFCQQLDNSSSGIKATIGKLMALLQVLDPELAQHMADNKVNPQFFAFRWITLLLTQEFPFPDAVRIWDTLLSDPAGRMDCLLRVCIALLTNVRQQLLEGDFSVMVKTLQRYPSVDVDSILRAAARLPPCPAVLEMSA